MQDPKLESEIQATNVISTKHRRIRLREFLIIPPPKKYYPARTGVAFMDRHNAIAFLDDGRTAPLDPTNQRYNIVSISGGGYTWNVKHKTNEVANTDYVKRMRSEDGLSYYGLFMARPTGTVGLPATGRPRVISVVFTVNVQSLSGSTWLDVANTQGEPTSVEIILHATADLPVGIGTADDT
jgi:hypothetical protein